MATSKKKKSVKASITRIEQEDGKYRIYVRLPAK